eukprot:2661374-Rhodomonas_salina.1
MRLSPCIAPTLPKPGDPDARSLAQKRAGDGVSTLRLPTYDESLAACSRMDISTEDGSAQEHGNMQSSAAGDGWLLGQGVRTGGRMAGEAKEAAKESARCTRQSRPRKHQDHTMHPTSSEQRAPDSVAQATSRSAHRAPRAATRPRARRA